MSLFKKNVNLIIAITGALLIWIILSVCFDFYYDLNDDLLIKDIISGVYTGSPDAHNNQMMYPISKIFVWLYSLDPHVRWFGIFEMGCLMLSFVLISVRLLEYIQKASYKFIFIICDTVFTLGMYLWELTMLQYTVICGALCAAVSVSVMTSQRADTHKQFFLNNALAIVLAIIAFNVRSEMFLLMCPFMAIAGIAGWLNGTIGKDNSSKLFELINVKQYISLMGIIIAGIVFTTAIDNWAYSSEDWKEFRHFFNARTEMYDFAGIPDYEANADFYKSNNITYDQYNLLVSYNFDLDKNITADTLDYIVSYVKSGKALKADGSAYNRLNKSLKTTAGEYIRGILRFDFEYKSSYDSPFQDEATQLVPYNLIVIMLYISIVILLIYDFDWKILVDVIVLAIFRSIAWMYIYYKGRLVPRITHPLFLIEAVILITLIIQTMYNKTSTNTDSSNNKEPFRTSLSGAGFTYIIFALIMALCIFNLIVSGPELIRKQSLREDINYSAQELNKYTESHEGYYLVDVYSTVNFTEKIFDDQEYDKSNQQLAGGWIARSPLDSQKSADADVVYFTMHNGKKWVYEPLK